jgi:amino acid transporter
VLGSGFTLAAIVGGTIGLGILRTPGEISKGGNPIFAVLLSWGFSVGLIMIGGFHFLLHLLIFFVLFITVVLIAGVIILRLRQPDADRPYRAWGHPWSTYTCLFGCILLALFQAVAQIDTAAYAALSDGTHLGVRTGHGTPE